MKKSLKQRQLERKKERFEKFFSEPFIRSEQSKAHSSFCERVFGKDLCQAGMMDMVQLEKLLKMLNLSAENNVLDLGCGIGIITEYISDLTGAHILGVDFASGAIRYANERACEKQDRIKFQEADINNLNLAPACVDTIISIDSLHFAKDMEKTIRQMMLILKAGGQMGIFYSQHCNPQNLDLTQILIKLDLNYQAWDYTKREHDLWYRQKQVLEEMKKEFESEGNLPLFHILLLDCQTMLNAFDAGKGRRLLYHIQLS